MAATNFTYWDVGGCNCPGCAFAGCALPLSNLVLTVSGSAAAAVYAAPCTWTVGCQAVAGAGSFFTTFGVVGACVYLASTRYNNTTCNPSAVLATYLYESTRGCSGLSGATAPSLFSVSCAPLSIVFKSGPFTWTITP